MNRFNQLMATCEWSEPSSRLDAPAGGGPGGTSDFAQRVREMGGVAEIINPTTLLG